jgi:GAF domain-containing protein
MVGIMSITSLVSQLPDTIRTLTVDADEALALGRIVDAALREIAGSELAGISALVKGSMYTRAPSHPQVELIDQAQYTSKEGPCVTAATTPTSIVVCNDLSADQRWPAFGPIAAAHGVNSMISFKLFDAAGTVGALNLYSSKPQAFGAEAEETGALLAAHAAVVLAASRKQANLAVALESRDVIGQAKGILMERYKLDDRAAFATLIAISQHTQRRLREIADELRMTGEVPGTG